MCTVIFHRALNLLAKNRDKNIPTHEEVVTSSDFVAVRTKGTDYFSLGVNRNGCAFVSTAVNTVDWMNLANKCDVEKAGHQYQLDNAGLVSPMKVVSDCLPYVQSINDWVAAIATAGAHCAWKGYHVILADVNNALVIELYKGELYQRPMQPKDFVVNHFAKINHGPKVYDDYPSTFDRADYLALVVGQIDSIDDLKTIVKPLPTGMDKKIWRKTDAFYTVSSSIIDIGRGLIHYAKNIDDPYEQFGILNV